MPRDSEVPLIPPDMTPRDDADEHLSPLAAGPAVGPDPGATSSSLATEKMALERHQIHAGSGSTAAPGRGSASSWDSTLIPSRKTPAALEMNKFRGTILMRRPCLCVVDFLIVWTLFSIVYVPGLGSNTFQGYCGIPVLGTYLTLAVFDNDAAQARLRLQMQREEAAAAAEAGVDGEGAGDEDSGGSNDAAAKEYVDDKSKGKVKHAAAGDYDFASLLSSSRRKLGSGSSDAGSTTTLLPADNINKWSLRTSLRKNMPGGIIGPLGVFGENAQMLDENQQKQEPVLGHPTSSASEGLVGAVAQDRQWWPYGASAPIQILNGEIDLVFFGGNHVSEACALDVLDVIEQLDPDAFAIELDLKRYDSKTARQKNSALLLHESLTFSFVDGRSFASTSVAFPAAEWNVFLEEKKNKTPAALPAPAGGLAPSSKTTTASSSSGGAAGSPEVDIAFYPLTLQAALTRWADAFERGDFAAGGQASGAAFGDTDFSAGVSLADAGLPSSSQARATLRSCDAFNYSEKYVVVFNRNYAPRRVAHEFAALGAAGVILLQEEHAAIKSWWLGLAPSRVNVPLKADEQAPRRTSVLYAPEQFSILGLVTDLLVHRGAAWRWKRGRPGIPLFVAAVPPSTSEDYTPVVDVVEDAWPQPIWAALDLQNMSQERRAFFEFVRNVVVKAPRPTTREDPLNSRPSQIIRVTARTNHAHTKVEADVHGQWLARTLRDAPIVSRYDYFRYTFSLYKNASGASTTATKQGNNSSPSFVFFLFPVVLLYTFTYLLGLRSGQEFVNQSKVAEYLKRPLFLVDSGDTDLGFEFRRRLCHPFQTLKTAVWFWTGVPRWLFTCLLFPMYSVDPLGVIVSTIARAPLLGVLAILLAAQFTTWLLAFAGYLLWNFLVATGLADFLVSGTSSALQGNAGAQEQMKGGATGGANGMNDSKAAPSAHDALNADAATPSSSFFGSTSEFGWFVVSLIAISIYVDIMLVQRNQFMSYNVLRFLEQHLGSENVERDQHVAVAGVNRAVDVADGCRTKKKRKLVLVGIGAMHGPGMTDLLQNETEFRHQVAVASGTVAQAANLVNQFDRDGYHFLRREKRWTPSEMPDDAITDLILEHWKKKSDTINAQNGGRSFAVGALSDALVAMDTELAFREEKGVTFSSKIPGPRNLTRFNKHRADFANYDGDLANVLLLYYSTTEMHEDGKNSRAPGGFSFSPVSKYMFSVDLPTWFRRWDWDHVCQHDRSESGIEPPPPLTSNELRLIDDFRRDGFVKVENWFPSAHDQAALPDEFRMESILKELRNRSPTLHRASRHMKATFETHSKKVDEDVFGFSTDHIAPPDRRWLLPLILSPDSLLRKLLHGYLRTAHITFTGNVRMFTLKADLKKEEYDNALWHHDGCGRRLKAYIYLTDVPEDPRKGFPTRILRGSHLTQWFPTVGYFDGPVRAVNKLNHSAVLDEFQESEIRYMGNLKRLGGFIFDTNALHGVNLETEAEDRDEKRTVGRDVGREKREQLLRKARTVYIMEFAAMEHVDELPRSFSGRHEPGFVHHKLCNPVFDQSREQEKTVVNVEQKTSCYLHDGRGQPRSWDFENGTPVFPVDIEHLLNEDTVDERDGVNKYGMQTQRGLLPAATRSVPRLLAPEAGAQAHAPLSEQDKDDLDTVFSKLWYRDECAAARRGQARPFLILKLDIDAPKTERRIIDAILQSEDGFGIDVLFWEHHVRNPIMQKAGWGYTLVDGDADIHDSMQLFRRLRAEKGIRAHSWI
eukprot:g493.t1